MLQVLGFTLRGCFGSLAVWPLGQPEKRDVYNPAAVNVMQAGCLIHRSSSTAIIGVNRTCIGHVLGSACWLY